MPRKGGAQVRARTALAAVVQHAELADDARVVVELDRIKADDVRPEASEGQADACGDPRRLMCRAIAGRSKPNPMIVRHRGGH